MWGVLTAASESADLLEEPEGLTQPVANEDAQQRS